MSVDQQGDNDGDGFTNREEILAGSSPYDPISRPGGPKVSIDFAASSDRLANFRAAFGEEVADFERAFDAHLAGLLD